MLSNAYFLAKFRFDTAENEPAKNLQNFAKFANFADPNPLTPRSRLVSGTLVLAVLPDAPVAAGHVPAVLAVLLGTDPGRGERPASCPTRSTSGPVG